MQENHQDKYCPVLVAETIVEAVSFVKILNIRVNIIWGKLGVPFSCKKVMVLIFIQMFTEQEWIHDPEDLYPDGKINIVFICSEIEDLKKFSYHRLTCLSLR